MNYTLLLFAAVAGILTADVVFSLGYQTGIKRKFPSTNTEITILISQKRFEYKCVAILLGIACLSCYIMFVVQYGSAEYLSRNICIGAILPLLIFYIPYVLGKKRHRKTPYQWKTKDHSGTGITEFD